MRFLFKSAVVIALTSAVAFSRDTAGDLGMEFVSIPAGTFLMGDPASGEYDDDSPVHEVHVEAFEMMTTEVTQAMWEAVTGFTIEEQRDRAHPSRQIYGAGPAYPVHYVSLGDCLEFIDELNRMDEDYTYRLPSEAEWEYACRAGTETVYYWGDDSTDIGSFCWMAANSGYRLHPVGELQPNPWGLYDMLGNAIELCEDLYHQNYEGAPADGSAWTDYGGYNTRISRGGSFDLGVAVCTCSERFVETPDARQHYLGFRLARTPR